MSHVRGGSFVSRVGGRGNGNEIYLFILTVYSAINSQYIVGEEHFNNIDSLRLLLSCR